MKKILYLTATLLFIMTVGCSNSPTAPSQNTQSSDSSLYPLQLALYLTDPSLGDPRQIPVDVPIGELISHDKIPTFSRYARATIDMKNWEPDDWDDWLVRKATNWEPDDWDDWLVKRLDDNCLNWEPDDWDDWLVKVAIIDIAEPEM